MTLANTIDDLYRVCDPDKPLSAQDPRYVDLAEVRGMNSLVTSITRKIVRTEPPFYCQQLLTGHRGCGKSTELLRLQAELESKRFFTVYLDVEDMLDLAEIDYLDVLLAIARAVEQKTRDSGLQLNAKLLEDLYLWFADKVLEQEERTDREASIKGEAQAGLELPFFTKLMTVFTGEIKNASSRRTHIRQTLERELPVFIDKLNALINEARQRAQQARYHDIVIIVDGLEKMYDRPSEDGQSSHAQLYLHHAEQLKAPACHLIYTVPISLAFNANLSDVFDMTVIPMVNTKPAGITQLAEIIKRRADTQAVFKSPKQLNELARFSGGVVRDLMHLIQLASDTDAPKIGAKEVTYARQTLVKHYDRLLRNQDLEAIRLVHTSKRVQADENFARLLNLRIVLEYQNGERWAGLHPAVTDISWIKEALSAGAATV